MLIIPRVHEPHLHRATTTDLTSIGQAIRTALMALRDRVGDVAYNVVFHAAPFHSAGQFHWHAHLLPKVATQAGFELGTGVPINICPPETAASELRVGVRV
jgi:UDPglucose--hexose-1-phosphate uridylyltransferase